MSPEIDAHLAALPEPQREALEGLRRTIRAAAPEAVEAISYSTPALKYRGRPPVSFGAAKDHCSLYCMSTAVMDEHREVLTAYGTRKGTIRFTPRTGLCPTSSSRRSSEPG